MIKVIYFGIVVVLLLPGTFAAIASLHCALTIHQIQHDEQSRTTDSVYVLGHTTVAVGPFRVPIYPHVWAAASLLAGVTLCIVGAVFLFFVRPW